MKGNVATANTDGKKSWQSELIDQSTWTRKIVKVCVKIRMKSANFTTPVLEALNTGVYSEDTHYYRLMFIFFMGFTLSIGFIC